ncbi:hypothetical protein [Winogradskyella haliclonae]|uniref:Uncharacterized protein n=1 Tax=Winogradskyella haliclonae TaxID=2048558 RepID=A0ABQ2BTP6_9FLAO|nr:hypothetical protein [Winogradskyella haliclonae]GGI55856.1 hypothetical protein GCM10011444_01650 [Winogradskyella haliclonae]
MAKTKLSLSKILISNWFITLFSTMLGVIGGLYLSNHFENKKLIDSKQNAIFMIKKELENNNEQLHIFDSISRQAYDKTSYVFSKMNPNYNIFIHKDSLNRFKEKSLGMVDNIETKPHKISRDSIQIKGDMNLEIGSKLAVLDLNDIVWNSYKQTNYMDVTSFDCVTSLEELYKLQHNNNTVNNDLMDLLTKAYFLKGEDQLADFMLQWQKALQMNSFLLNAYSSTEEILSNCN